MSLASYQFYDPYTITAASAVAFLSLNRSDLSVTDTVTMTAAHLWTFTAQIVLPNDPVTALQAATKQYVDNSVLAVQPANVAAAIGSWQSYTPTWTAVTTNPVLGNGSLLGFWRRVGESIEVAIQLTLGSTSTMGSGAWIFSMPSGYTADYTKASADNVGIVKGFCAGTNLIGYDVSMQSTSSFNVVGPGNYVGATYPGTWVSTNNLILRASIPVTQFQSNINLLTSFTEYAYNSSTSTTTDTTSFGYGPAGVLFQAFAPGGMAFVEKTVRFTKAILPTDLIVLEVLFSGSDAWTAVANTAQTYGSDGSTKRWGMGININTMPSANTDVIVSFGAYANSWSSAWSGFNTAYWRVRKVSNGNFAQGSPSYSQTFGDGATLVYTITHNLGTMDLGVSIIQTGSPFNIVTSTPTIAAINPNQITLTYGSAPATNSLRVTVLSSGGTVAAGDRLSTIANAEKAISGAATATLRCWHNCTATSANYALTLPPAASCSGQFIGIRIDPSSTYLVTVTGNTAETIDGSNTRIMWAGESCELKSNGVNWNKVGGRTIPMISIANSSAQSLTGGAQTKLSLSTEVGNNISLLSANGLVVKRPGKYRLDAFMNENSGTTQAANSCAIFQNTTQINIFNNRASQNYPTTSIWAIATAATGDAFYTYGTIATTSANVTGNLSLVEIPTW